MTPPPAAEAPTLAEPYAHAAEAEVLALLRGQARRFVARSVDSAAIDRAGQLGPAVLGQAAEAGLFGLTLPEAYGGAGLSLKAACTVVADLARHDRAVAIAAGLHAGLGTRPLVTAGSPSQQAEYLPEMARGSRVGAFAATEAGAGSDLTAIATTALHEGDRLCLRGEKCYVTNGGFAGVFTVLASTPGLGGARAFSLVCVPRETPGLRIGPEEHKLGLRGSSTVTVTFDDARVPLGALLGPPGRGMDLAHGALTWGRTLMAAGCVGTARAALDLTLSHVSTRRQFGRPLRACGAVRAQVADMAAAVFTMESLVRQVGALEARGAPLEADSLAAKVYCSEAAWAVCDRAVQLHGALGYIEATGVARLLRDGRITRIFEGANDVLLLRGGFSLLTARAAPPLLDGRVSPSLHDGAARHDQLARRLDAALGATRAAYGVRVIGRQLLVQRLARAEVCRAAAHAALVRATDSGDPRDASLATLAAFALCAEAERHLDDAAVAPADEVRAEAVVAWIFEEPREDVG